LFGGFRVNSRRKSFLNRPSNTQSLKA